MTEDNKNSTTSKSSPSIDHSSLHPSSLLHAHPVITQEQAYDCLRNVIDPELHIDIVGLGLIYDVTVRTIQKATGPSTFVHILMTLTTPGCPLAGVFGQMVKDQFEGIVGLDPAKDIEVELTFDPPWLPDMMSEEARAELGL